MVFFGDRLAMGIKYVMINLFSVDQAILFIFFSHKTEATFFFFLNEETKSEMDPHFRYTTKNNDKNKSVCILIRFLRKVILISCNYF